MANIFLVIIVSVAVFGAVAWLTREREKKPVQSGTSVNNNASNHVADGWLLRSIGSGHKVFINNKEAEIRNICLVCDHEPESRRFDVSFTFEFTGGEQVITNSGKTNVNTQFTLNGTKYYGVILAGGPEAKIKEIHRFTVV